MQSEERVVSALATLRPRIAAFRLAVSGALERARSTLESESGPSHARTTLGEFGGRLIDADRFATISSGAGPLDPGARAAVERAAEVLETLLGRRDEQFFVDTPSGCSPAWSALTRLADLGSAFRCATLTERVRRRSFDTAHYDPDYRYPFREWTNGERRLAPPVVLRLDGQDLSPFELGALMDGWVRLILLVDGPCAPAPLARLISPGVFVAQSDDAKIVEGIADFDGPAVVAVMSGAEARFVHDPRAGSAVWQRISITRVPEATPKKSLGARSAWQQRDDLAHLQALAAAPSLRATLSEEMLAGVGATNSDPTERLTEWLLAQASPDGIP